MKQNNVAIILILFKNKKNSMHGKELMLASKYLSI